MYFLFTTQLSLQQIMDKGKQVMSQRRIRSTKQFMEVQFKQIGIYSYDISSKIVDAAFTQFPVYQGLNNQTNEKVAIQIAPNNYFHQNQDQLAFNSSSIKLLNKTYIMKYFDVFVTKNNHYFISETWDNTLQDMLIQNKSLSIPQAFKYFVQIFNAVYHLYENDIIHISLHPRNIVLKNGCCKLAGFRLLKEKYQHLQNDIRYSHYCKTKANQFSSPQFVKYKIYSDKCSVWSLGALLLFMVTGKIPNNIPSSNIEDTVKRPPKCTDFIWKILNGCLQIEESSRSTLQYLKSVIYQGQKPISLKLIQNALPKQLSKSQHQIKVKHQTQTQQIFRNQLDYIYFMERLVNIVKNCRPLGFSQKLEYLLQFSIRSRIKEIECLITQCQENGIFKCQSALFNSLLQQFRRIKQQHKKQVEKRAGLFSSQRLKVFDRNDYSFSQNLNMQLQAILREYIQDLNKLLTLLSSQEQVINHQNQILLLDFLMTYFQLNGLIIEYNKNRRSFAQLSCLDQIVEAPILVNLKTYQLIKEKINSLHLK